MSPRICINRLTPIIAICLLLVTASPYCVAQIEVEEKHQIIDSVNARLIRSYVYPNIAELMSTSIRQKLNSGEYNNIDSPAQFAAQLTSDLVKVSGDRHLNITFDPDWVSASRKVLTRNDSLNLIHKDFPHARRDNFGFKEIKVLDGNIGYLNLTKFYDPKGGGETAAAAMNFLANTDALIIDLRQNGGGYGDMVQLVASYLFDAEPILIVEIESKEQNERRQDWTLPYVPGKRLIDKPVYVLTSNATFSAAESFTYFLKNRKRATVIGETTGGGAHPVQHRALNDRFTIFVPYARPIDPLTKTDWEKTGVKPDISVPAKDALITAQITALEKILASNPGLLQAEWAISYLKAQQQPIKLSLATIKQYAGSYSSGIRKLVVENGELYFQRTGQPKYRLVPLTDRLFMVEELPYLRVRIDLENGKVKGFTRQYDDGTSSIEIRDVVTTGAH
jgi:retinol-binding protein 3